MKFRLFLLILALILPLGSMKVVRAANVAIIDSGINSVGRIGTYRDLAGEWDYAGHNYYPIDLVGHGTQVALAFLDYALGVPQGAPRITALKVGNAPGAEPDAVVWALRDAAGWINNIPRQALGGPSALTGSRAIDVINMSFGGYDYQPATHAAMNDVYFRSDALMVMCAGNDGQVIPAIYPGWLAHYFGTRGIVVGAASASGSIHGYSNRAGYANMNNYIVAHAEASGPWAGTSFSAPRVTGTASAIKDRWPHLTGAQIGSIILNTATDMGARGPDPIYGMGMLNFGAALSPVGGRWFSLNKSRHNVAGSTFKLSSAFSQIANANPSISFFDAYDRDFQMSLNTERFSMAERVRQDMMWSGLGARREKLASFENGNWSFASSISRDGEPDLDGLSFQLSFDDNRRAIRAGYGKATNWYYQPRGFIAPAGTNHATTSGVNPILQLAEGGVHLTSGLYFGKNLSLTSGYASNEKIYGQERHRLATSDTEALMLSLTANSASQELVGNITISNIEESNGVLGSRLNGAFSQGANNIDTIAISFGGDVSINKRIVLSGSYTLAQSNTGGGASPMLALSDRVISDAMAFGFRASNLFIEEDNAYLSISRPLGVTYGAAKLAFDSHIDRDKNLHTSVSDINLRPTDREIDLQLGYAQPLGRSSEIKALIFHAQNFDHRSGVDKTGGLIRYELTF